MVRLSREDLRRGVIDALGDRELIWSGLRGDDAESLSDLPQFTGSFSIIAAYQTRPLKASVAYEDLSGSRPDLETWDIDDHLDAPASRHFRWSLMRAMAARSALLPYRPSDFQSSVVFARQAHCLYLGLFGAHQNAFEHKPWVESSVRALGVPSIQWTYIADEEQIDAERLLADGPVMLRRSRTSGGEGLVKVSTSGELEAHWPRGKESFVSVSHFIPTGLPVNVGATVWDDGVTVHLPSVQLVGIPECTTRPFGYCGNDFGAAKDLDPALLANIETSTSTIGRWLHRYGYRGTFGVDYLVEGDVALFTEVNARFQGSTRASARLALDIDAPCLLLEHIAATLGAPALAGTSLIRRINEAPDLAQFVIHWLGPTEARTDVDDLLDAVRTVDGSARMDAGVPSQVTIQPGATMARFTLARRLTRTGFELDADLTVALNNFWEQQARNRGPHNAGSIPN